MTIIRRIFSDWIMPIVIAAIIALAINKFLFFQVSVPSESMFPAIKPGDRIIVTRTHNVENLERGNIVVFYSDELSETLIKRLIGLPGDEIEIKSTGEVYINNIKHEEAYVKSTDNKVGKYKVPEGSYFFLGDNRKYSLDARYWKEPYISEEKIKGRARFIIFPFDRVGAFE